MEENVVHRDVNMILEPVSSKTYMLTCAPIEISDQPAHL